MIDTHAHLDAFGERVPEVLDRACAAGVTRVIAVGSGLDSCRATLALAERNEGVFCALGIHPHQAGAEDAGGLAKLGQLLRHERAVAVGETGLDYFRELAPVSAQRALFEAHLSLACELSLPVVIHSRAAARDTASALARFQGTVILHCFSDQELLPVALERGYYLSFAGNVTYPRAHDLRAAAALVPAERLLVETDSPYLAPQPVRGRQNEPAFVVHVLRALASLRRQSPDELAARIDANAASAFGLP